MILYIEATSVSRPEGAFWVAAANWSGSHPQGVVTYRVQLTNPREQAGAVRELEYFVAWKDAEPTAADVVARLNDRWATARAEGLGGSTALSARRI
jgi:hypothetical protein